MKSVIAKLLAVQSEIRAPKNQTNTFGGYKYRSCEDILEAAKPLLKSQGLVLTISDDVRLIGDRYYIQSTSTLTCVETGEAIINTAMAREPTSKKGADDSQITGAASSYCRKYLLNGLFLIDDTKDADATNDHGKGGGRAPARHEQSPDQPEPSTEADAMIVAQLNAAATVPDLVKVMNSLTNDQQKLVRSNFNQRMNELKKAA